MIFSLVIAEWKFSSSIFLSSPTDSVANFTDVLREGPDEPYYFGLTTPANTHAYFGVNCDMPGLHFEVAILIPIYTEF